MGRGLAVEVDSYVGGWKERPKVAGKTWHFPSKSVACMFSDGVLTNVHGVHEDGFGFKLVSFATLIPLNTCADTYVHTHPIWMTSSLRTIGMYLLHESQN